MSKSLRPYSTDLSDAEWELVEVSRHRDRQAWRYGLEARPPRGTFQVLPRRWVVERTFAWLSTVPALEQGLRAAAADQRKPDLHGHEPAHA